MGKYWLMHGRRLNISLTTIDSCGVAIRQVSIRYRAANGARSAAHAPTQPDAGSTCRPQQTETKQQSDFGDALKNRSNALSASDT